MKRILLGMLLLPLAESIRAQQSFTNTGNMTIHSGASLAVHGNFTNASTAALVNNGSLYIKSNLTSNQAAMSSGGGTLYLNGTAAQTIDGAQPFNTLNLVTANSAGMLLNTNLQVSGTHTFTSGVIATSATPNYLEYTAGASYTGAGDASHINGWVKKAGTTNFIFPVGNGSVQRTVAINSLSASSVFAVKYNAATPNTSQLQSPLVTIDPNEYWEINKESGGTASVTLNWDHSKVAFPPFIVADIKAAAYVGGLWVSQGGTASGTVTTTGAITSNAVSTFGRFTFGSTSTLLPLTLLSFDARRKNEQTEITWKTTEERQVSHFIVERSENGTDFYSIGKVTARNSGQKESYALYDNKPIVTTAWYRLKSVDLDGAFKLSAIVRVSETAASSALLVNNPVREQIILTAKGDLSGEFNYTLHDMHGKTVQRGKVVLRSNTQTMLPVVAAVPAGTYTIRLQKAGVVISKKILIASAQ